ncbi:50S ribosomal protein L9 [Candidatus Formimonas warabiya]|uniref:Large ribosomal subunit protein bL9 n=1 Tax=Formimonas warabiya TaxID=1761012 RepID=A0A3G1KUS4_FORW1|nr:50S ribosomal protein L9 [Candidatus Formimonas warabiya]ATW26228.1 50S ribosomal protein L9 [Candidatus Formimonas warabiya]
MRIILTQDVKSLGKKGDVVQVAEGYGRNFLLPRGLGMEASPANMASLAHENARLQAKKTKELEDARALGKKLQEAVVHIAAKAGEGGRLFGSVTNKEISEQIQHQFQVEIDKRKIELKEAIKSIGTYDAVVKLHSEVQAKIKIDVSAQ